MAVPRVRRASAPPAQKRRHSRSCFPSPQATSRPSYLRLAMAMQHDTETVSGEAFAEVGPLGPPFPIDARVNHAGHLEIGGCDVLDVAKEFGTPSYIYASGDLRERARAAVKAFRDAETKFGDGSAAEPGVLFASKSFPCSAAYRLMAAEGIYCDVASGGELHLALKGGFAPERILVHGNNKTDAELEQAIAAGVGYIVIDSFD